MRIELPTVLLLTCATLAAPVPKPDPKPKPAAEAVLGKWRMADKYVGTKLANDHLRMVWTFGQGYLRMEIDRETDRMPFSFNCKLAEAEPFARFDFSAGEVTERNADHGIFAVDGDTLTVCYAVEFNPAPKELKPQEGTYFYRFRRVKE